MDNPRRLHFRVQPEFPTKRLPVGVSVVIADDHAATRVGHRAVIDNHPDLAFGGMASDGAAALALIRARSPDVALVDLRMPALDGLEITQTLVAESHPTRVLLVSAYPEPEIIRAALQRGVGGFASKRTSGDELARLILAVARGHSAVSADLQPELAALISTRDGAGALTPRQIQILQLMADGQKAEAIGQALDIAPTTVRSTQRVIYAKLGVADRAQAVAVAMRRGLIT